MKIIILIIIMSLDGGGQVVNVIVNGVGKKSKLILRK